MKKYMKLLPLLVIPALAFAGGAEHTNAIAEQYLKLTGRETDFVPRLFNFILLVALLAYLLAKPIKEFLNNRTAEIAKKLEEIEKTRQEAIEAKNKAKEELAQAKSKVVEILDDASKEALYLKEKILSHAEDEMKSLEKSCKDNCEIVERKTVREVTATILDENITENDIPLNAKKIVKIVTKEVA